MERGPRSARSAAVILGLALTVASCRRADSPLSPSPVSAGPSQPLFFTVSGTVLGHTAAGVAPVEGVRIHGVTRTDRSSANFVLDLPTDSTGHYVLGAAPGSDVLIQVEHLPAGLSVGRCLISLSIAGNVTRDIDLYSPELQVSEAEMRATVPTLSGVVFELAGGVRQPVKGVSVGLYDEGYVELDSPGLPVAGTVTDVEGRYVLCGLPRRPMWGGPSMIEATKTGFQTTLLGMSLVGNVTALDIEIRR